MFFLFQFRFQFQRVDRYRAGAWRWLVPGPITRAGARTRVTARARGNKWKKNKPLHVLHVLERAADSRVS
jgi:hypothetical protein